MPLIDTAEIWKVLKAFGLNERKLALSDLDDARLIAQQVCDQLGCICENEHIQSVWELIHDCQMSEPIQKRLRGDHRIGELSGLRFLQIVLHHRLHVEFPMLLTRRGHWV